MMCEYRKTKLRHSKSKRGKIKKKTQGETQRQNPKNINPKKTTGRHAEGSGATIKHTTHKATRTNQQLRRGRHRIKYTREREDDKTQVRAMKDR